MGHGGRRRGSGRRPKPVEMKVVQGTFRKHRDAKKLAAGQTVDQVAAALESTAEASPLQPVRGLGERGCELWALALKSFGGWTKTSDTFALAALVSLMQLAEENRATREKSALHRAMLAFRRRRDGDHVYLEARENPLVLQALRIDQAIRRWLVEFGATPSARMQMREAGAPMAPPVPPDAFEDYLQKQRGRSND